MPKTIDKNENIIRYIDTILKFPNYIIIFFITLYQKTLSPDHGILKSLFPNGYCRFHPTCSEYCKQSFEKYDFIKAFIKSIYRIIRCNPFSKGGIDNP